MTDLSLLADAVARFLTERTHVAWRAETLGEPGRDERARLYRIDGAELTMRRDPRRPDERLVVRGWFPRGYEPWDRERSCPLAVESRPAWKDPFHVGATVLRFLDRYEPLFLEAARSQSKQQRKDLLKRALLDVLVAEGPDGSRLKDLKVAGDTCAVVGSLTMRPLYDGASVEVRGTVSREAAVLVARAVAAHPERDD